LAVLVAVTTHPDAHSIWPAPEQPHWPALQAAPAGQAIPQAPQLRGSFPLVTMQVWSGHSVSLGMQPEAQAPPLQTCPSGQAVWQFPQCMTSDETQVPLQLNRFAWH